MIGVQAQPTTSGSAGKTYLDDRVDQLAPALWKRRQAEAVVLGRLDNRPLLGPLALRPQSRHEVNTTSGVSLITIC